MSQIESSKVDLPLTTVELWWLKSIEQGDRKVIADHFEKISPIYRKQILKMIADHF
jgi:hypothetical protein